MRNLWRVFFSLVLVLIVVAPGAYAIDDPDALELYGIHAYRHYLEDDDLLVTARYRCAYDAYTGVGETQESYTTGGEAVDTTESVQESYTVDDDNATDIYGSNWSAQSFTVSSSFDVTRVRLLVYRVGEPGYVDVEIRTVSDGDIDSVVLVSGSLHHSYITIDTVGAWTEFVLDSTYKLESGVYAITLSAPAGDSTNKVVWRWDITSPAYTDGKVYASTSGGASWADDVNKDLLFEVWGRTGLTIYGDNWAAQTFTALADYTIDKVRLQLLRGGSPGYVYLALRETNGEGHPVGGDLVLAQLNANALTTEGTGTWYALDVTDYDLEKDVKYALILYAPSGYGEDTIHWVYDSTGSFDNGEKLISSSGGVSWSADSEHDFLFEVYGTLTVGSVITDTFLGRFLDDGVELRATAPYSYNNDGYGYGIFSLYWKAVDAPTWLDVYTVTFEGNPLQSWSGSPPSASNSAIAWHNTSTQSATSGILALNILATATSLEDLWDINLLEDTAAGPRLTTHGAEYFTNAIPNLRTGCPNVFSTSTTTVGWEEVVHDTTYQEELGTSWDDTGLKDAAVGLGEFFGGLSGGVMMTFIFILFAAGVVAASVLGMGPQVTVPLLIVLVLMGPVTGFVPLQIALVVGGLAGMALAYTLFYKVVT